jgi:L-fucose mutarotase
MLKGLSPLLTPDLLHALASMGHGDELAIVDAHFPAVTLARRLIRIDAAEAPAVLAACLSLVPLDGFVSDPAVRMEVVGKPADIPPVAREFQAAIERAEGSAVKLRKVDRHSFYDRASKAFAIVLTGEQRTYGNIIIKKGVVQPA